MFFFSHTLHDGVESIDILSSKSNLPDSNAVARSLSDISAALVTFAFGESDVTDSAEKLADERSTLITPRPRGFSRMSSDGLRG